MLLKIPHGLSLNIIRRKRVTWSGVRTRTRQASSYDQPMAPNWLKILCLTQQAVIKQAATYVFFFFSDSYYMRSFVTLRPPFLRL